MITLRILPLQDQANRLDSSATQLLWLEEAEKGLADIAAGRSADARTCLAAIQKRRASAKLTDLPNSPGAVGAMP
jgi:predicted transcriptional regulator